MSSNTTLQQAQQHLTTAKALHKQQKYEQAIPLLEEVVKTLEGKEKWEEWLEAAYLLIQSYRIEYHFSEMDNLLDHALKIHAQKYPHLVAYKARLFIEKGTLLSVRGKLEEGMAHYRSAYQSMEKEKTRGFLLIYPLLCWANACLTLGQIPKAQELLDKALKLLKLEENQDDTLWAEFYYLKGIMEYSLANYRLAQQNFEKAYQRYPPNIFSRKAAAQQRAGTMYALLGESEKGIAYFQKLMKEKPIATNNREKMHSALIHEYTARIFRQLGDLGQAIAYHENALRLMEEAGGDTLPNLAMVLESLSIAYSMQGNFSKQIETGERALAINQKLYGGVHPRIAEAYRILATAYHSLGKIETAWNHYQKALKIFSESLGEDHANTVKVYVNIGAFWTQYKQPAKALEFFSKALKHSDNYGDQRIKGFIHGTMANNFHELGQIKTALEHYQLALVAYLPNYQNSDFYHLPRLEQCASMLPNHLVILLQNKARILHVYFESLEESKPLEALKALKASLATCQFTIDYLQDYQKNLKAENSKWIFSVDMLSSYMNSVYELSIKVVLTLANRLGDEAILEQAFTFQELATAFLLSASMQENEAKLQAAIAPDLLQQEKDLKNQMENCLQQIQKEEAKLAQKEVEADEKALKAWKQKHFDALQSHQKLIEQLEEEYPKYYQLKYNFQTVSVAELQAALDDNTAIISYFIGDELSYVFGVTNEEYEVIELELPSNFDQQIQAYLDAIHAHDYTTFNELSHQLYYHLIRPIDYLIFDPFEETAKNLVIIPSASLHYLPFETLIRNKSQNSNADFHQLDYLIRDCQIQYHYSATLFHQNTQATIAKRRTDANQASKQASSSPSSSSSSNSIDFLGFAPIYTSDKEAIQATLRDLAADYSRWASRSEAIRDGKLVPLPFSEQEVQNIQNLFTKKGLKGQSLLYDTATKAHFKTLASNAKYLHIAAHGLTNDQYPKLSGIVFYPTGTTADIQDSVLSMGEMYQLQLQADLVVLSSCESGIGQLAKGEGMIAMNRSFLYAGAKNVVFTLFKVLDKPSSDLCSALFEGILEGKTYSEALREAKLKLIKQEGMDPKSWCGFVLLGA